MFITPVIEILNLSFCKMFRRVDVGSAEGNASFYRYQPQRCDAKFFPEVVGVFLELSSVACRRKR